MGDNQLESIRHSMSHVMAEAVLEMFPTAQIAIGPAIENGFYYDFDLPRALNMEDLEEISERMRKIISEDKPFERTVVSRDEAKRLFAGQHYKQELIEAIPEDEEVSLYNQGGFTDLCRGPHVKSTKELNPDAFKLLNIAGAYWRGIETNPMLTRIYGTAWKTPKDLRIYLQKLEEIEKRDHRKLGKELDLFSFHEEAGPGLVYWHPKGGRIRMAIEDFWKKEHYANGYEMVVTPHVGKSWLWETSGHLDFYQEGMFSPMEMDKSDYYAKPMNCPFHIMIYKNKKHSYRDLPFRWAELGTVYRYEKAGALHGLLRVRGFTQDDAHIFCTPDQMEGEIREVIRFSLHMLRSFGFQEVSAYLSTRPKESVGEEAQWEAATESLRRALEEEGLEYGIDEGGGAFYGPKIDLKIKDALSREWQLSTIQFDFNEPQRFNMTFVDSDGVEKRPYMIHRALLGSIERFFGVLIEHYAGAFPIWLAPDQVCVIPVSEVFNDYAHEVFDKLKRAGIRVYIDDSDDRMNAKIRNAQQQKVPHMLVLGEREKMGDSVSVRYRSGKQENGIPFATYLESLQREIDEKR
ncbi:MAG: threonine--tRNA ligase [Sphaerochaetaceae bacterium]|nr:threonine--tRNA ligase [Sphaerochaetaceae bacterium]